MAATPLMSPAFRATAAPDFVAEAPEVDADEAEVGCSLPEGVDETTVVEPEAWVSVPEDATEEEGAGTGEDGAGVLKE